jgi:hypothetical protein
LPLSAQTQFPSALFSGQPSTGRLIIQPPRQFGGITVALTVIQGDQQGHQLPPLFRIERLNFILQGFEAHISTLRAMHQAASMIGPFGTIFRVEPILLTSAAD